MLLFSTKKSFCRTWSLSNATFSFLITWRSPSSKSAAVYKISWKSHDFSLRCGDISIFKMAADRHLVIVYHNTRPPWSLCCWPQLPVKFHVNLIHRSEDIAIWIFRIFGLKFLFRPPKWGLWGLWTPKCDYSPSRPPKCTSLHTCASFKLSTVKIRWGELTESVTNTDTHTHTGKFISCPCIALDKQQHPAYILLLLFSILIIIHNTVTQRQFLSCVSILTRERDIDIANLSVCLSVCSSVRLSVRDVPVSDKNGLT